MYLRTTKRKNKDGTSVEYYQLAHNYWNPETKKSVPQVIHSFGRTDKLDIDVLKRLCLSIAKVCGIEIKDTPEEKKQSIPNDVKIIQTFELGTVMAIESIWERLGIGNILRKIVKEKNCKVAYERAIFAMVANRLCEPDSKFGVWDRWLPKVYLPSCQELKLDHMYEAMDVMLGESEKIEEEIFFKTANLLNLDVELIFYDTTTVSFSIDANDCDEFRKLGHPKEGGWSPQVVVALAVTKDGLPVRSWVFPGNTADTKTVEKVKKDLRGWNLSRVIFVGDGGMDSDENRKELSKGCGKYLLATRMGSIKEIKEEVLTRAGKYRKIEENLHAKEVLVGDGESRRRYIVCYNPNEEERQKEHRVVVLKELKEELEKHPKKSVTAKWAIELLSSKRYKRYLKIENSEISLDKAAIEKAGKYDGKWVLITNDDTLSVEDAAKGYKNLYTIEKCFRSLKRTQIQMGPVYHRIFERIKAHVKICVMALLIQRVAEIECKDTWGEISTILEKLQITEFQNKDYKFYQRNELSSKVKEILKKLGIHLPCNVLAVQKISDS